MYFAGMATTQKRGAEFDDTTNCPVCLESFDTEEIVPRILPCFHSVCLRCLERLIKNKKFVTCPQCRKRHKAGDNFQSFPENKYIVRNLEEKKEIRSFDVCQKHPKLLNLYCKNDRCGMEICNLCISESHSRHELVDLEQEEKGKIDTLTNDLKRCEKELRTANRDSSHTSENVIRQIEKEKEKFIRRFDSMVAKVRDTQRCDKKQIGDCIEYVSTCSKKVQGTGTNVKSRMKTLDEAEVKVKDICKIELTYNYFEHKSTELDETEIDRICGELVTKGVCVNLSGEGKVKKFYTGGKIGF